jgi:hypothetical protein
MSGKVMNKWNKKFQTKKSVLKLHAEIHNMKTDDYFHYRMAKELLQETTHKKETIVSGDTHLFSIIYK